MPQYVLECPKCLSRFKLKKYLPGRRVICRHCRAVMEIPPPDPSSAVPPVSDPKPGLFAHLKGKKPLLFVLLFASSAIVVGLAFALIGF